MSDATVLARIPALIAKTLDAAGGDGAALLARHGIDPAVFENPDARVPLALEQKLWLDAAAEADDPAFGLAAVYQYGPGEFDVFDFAIRKSPTLRAALEAVCRYNRLVHDVAEIRLVEEDGVARIEHWFRGDAKGACWPPALFTVASWLVVGRQLTGVDWAATGVWFQRPEPPDSEPVRAVFGDASIRFDQPINALLFDAAHLDLPLQGGDPALQQVLLRHADVMLERLPAVDEDRTLHQIRAALPELLREGAPSMEAMAADLQMSPRTLQRRLKDLGTTFKDVVEEVRRHLAMSLLEERKMGIADVAYLLGYSEPSAFQRAFKRWTGESVGAWRDARA
jgi:AraC-like DNA-binding protein